ncbi:hypothetical protein KVR01_007382 [Diaporthe batatas]|uniref:uncharacterized protein n=1 Tax=Diaporthe batatas TaxID=748121 RepID=UPI001D0375B2|nr:uncharacterized protein KVR01_007382 [Diaporthe batatas]KAG8162904.1 hypothetical protein KVR01_007382 [Diaporthe batatas]
MGIINILGLISNAIGYWGFADDMFPAPEDGHSTFKVYVAIDGTGPDSLEDAGGSIRNGKLFNSFGVDIGHGGSFPHMKSGSSETITIWQSVPQQAPWVMLFASKDAVCIAAIGATLIDGTHWGWVGDWGQLCGLPWYYSGVKGSPQWNDTSPHCTWIDADHSNGLSAGGITIHWPGFTDAVLPVDNGKGKCGTEFDAWDKEGGKSVIKSKFEDWEGQNASGMLERHGHNTDRRLVVSTADAHSAEELCRDPMSRGPNFVSMSEQAHCDMQTREVLPLCRDGLTAGCFDLEAAAAEMRTSTSDGGGDDTGDLAHHIIYW